MAWIEVVDEEDWDGELSALRGRLADPGSDRVDAIMAIHSLNPGAMAAHDSLYRSAMRSTASLRKVERELIAYLVSAINECHY